MPRQVTVFFRFDDFSESSPTTVEVGLVDALRHNQVCATFGVIPSVTEGSFHQSGERRVFPLGSEKIRFLRRAIEDRTVDVALHGWTHRTVATTPPHSEFVGMTLDDQIAKIANGQEFLRRSLNVEPRVFIPPWNTYDVATLDALADRGFACLSANRYGPSDGRRLSFAPITTDMAEFRHTVAAAKRSADSDPIIGVLLHPYDFKESGDARAVMTCAAFAAELRWLTREPGVRVVPLSRLTAENQTLGAKRYRANQPLLLEHIAPPFVATTRATPFYRSEAGARRTKALKGLMSLSVYALLIGAGFFLHRFVRLEIEPRVWQGELSPYLVGALLLALLARTAVTRAAYFRAMLVLALLSGMVIDAWVWSGDAQ